MGLGGGVSRAAGADRATGTQPATLGNAGLNVAYEVDLFGRISQGVDAARLDAEGREALLQSTRLAVQAEVAQTYLQLRALDDERALMRKTVDAYRDTLRLSQRREQAGDIAELDVARIQAELSATESDALALDRQRSQMEHALAVLVGDSASRFDLPGSEWLTAYPAFRRACHQRCFERRPDISAAQRAVFAAQLRGRGQDGLVSQYLAH